MPSYGELDSTFVDEAILRESKNLFWRKLDFQQRQYRHSLIRSHSSYFRDLVGWVYFL